MSRGSLSLILLALSVVFGGSGFALYAKFKEKPGVTSFGLSPKGILSYVGIILMIAGAIAAGMAVMVFAR